LKPKTNKLYPPHEFAALAGVTVRALHYYDRVGLLKPLTRTDAGYRQYSERDLVRLEQIVLLKFLGFSLRQIRDLLADESDILGTLRRQCAALGAKRSQLDRAIRVIRETETTLAGSPKPDWKDLVKIIKEIEMNNDNEWMKKYYSAEAKSKLEKREALWSPELQARVSRQWSELFADIEASFGEDPAGPKAQALLTRWRNLIAEFTGGDPAIQSGLNSMYADRGNWPEQQKKSFEIRPEIEDFIRSAAEAEA
jgi:MerR family transcriptional regulator, thiopeptide resistance regulator